MRKIFDYFCFIVIVISCFSTQTFALEFKAGTYYFDNSKLNYSSVKFLVGNEDSTLVYNMTKLQDKDWWSLQLPQDLNDLNGYCFLCSNKPEGIYNIGINNFLSCLETDDPFFRHTKVRDNAEREPEYLTGWIFYPINDCEISDGYWRTGESYDVTPSGTVPTIHIYTQDFQTIADKENYIDGTFWLDNCNIEGYESLGSQSEPLTIQIKGRGNWSWTYYYKKPYKIKFAQKQSPLGLDNSKHFVLLPKAGDWSGYLRDETGFELSRQLNMPYTVRFLPVEVILNDDYIGLYFLGEKIRVESGRVDILEQQDMDTNPYNVSGGWLLELGLDGTIVHQHHENNDPDNFWYSILSQSPEQVSQVQVNYIHNFLSQADSCIFVTDKNDQGWERYFDIDILARFYMIHEIMENVESFTGSLFMYKDWGEDEKLKFGPVWDFDNSYWHDATTSDHFFYEYQTQPYFTPLWIREMLKFPHIQQKIRMVWKEFMKNNSLNKVIDHAWYWRSLIEEAEQHDKQRWRYASIHGPNAPAEFIDRVSRKVAWLDEQWSVPAGDVNCDGTVSAVDITIIYNYLLNGDETYKSSSDVNGDGIISSIDITEIYNILLGN